MLQQIVSLFAAVIFGALALWLIVLIHHPRVDDGILPKLGLGVAMLGLGAMALRFADPYHTSFEGIEKSVAMAVGGIVFALLAQMWRRHRASRS